MKKAPRSISRGFLEPIIVPEAKRGKIMASDRSVYGLCTMKRNKLVRYKQRFIEE